MASYSSLFSRSTVEFESREDMHECIRKADNTELGGRKIRLVEVSTCSPIIVPVFLF